MSEPRSLPSSSDSDFFRGSAFDRYHGDLDDYSDIPQSVVFKEPPKIQPRKSKFYTLCEEEMAKDKNIVLKPVAVKNSCKEVQVAAISESNSISKNKVSGQVLREKYAEEKDKKHRLNHAHPHGSIESNTESEARVKLFDKAQNSTLLAPPPDSSKSVSLPVTPNASPRLIRKLSSSNILQLATMGVLNKTQSHNLNDMKLSIPDSERKIVQRETMEVARPSTTKTEDKPDFSIPLPSSIPSQTDYSQSAFGNWFKKKFDVKERDVNVFSPTSY